MKTEDFDYIKKKMEKSVPDLPDALEEGEIVSLLEGRPQQAKPRRRLVPLLASAAAMLVLISGVTLAVRFAGGGVRLSEQKSEAPAEFAQESAAPSPEETEVYDQIGALLSDRIETPKGANAWNSFANGAMAGYGGTTMFAAEEDAYVSDSSYLGVKSDAMPSESAAMQTESARGDDSFSTLNTRTDGVDETDIYRTDGKYIYLLHNDGHVGSTYWFSRYTSYGEFYSGGAQTFSVVSPNGGEMQELSVKNLSLIDPAAKSATRERFFSGFFLYGDYAVLTGNETEFLTGRLVYDEQTDTWGYDYKTELRTKSRGLILFLDLSDPAAPKEAKTLYFDSSILDARIADHRLITVSRYYPDPIVFNEDDYKTFIPYCGDAYISAPCIRVPEGDDGASFFSVTVTDLADGSFPCESVSVLGSAYDFYCSGDAVYAYGNVSEYVDEETGWNEYLTLYKIDVGGLTPEYKAEAHLERMCFYDDYSIDAYGAYLRLAVQQYDRGGEWNRRTARVLVLDENLETVAQTEPFGEGETIESVRFSGDMAYVVTFYQTDPLFAVDLSDPLHPMITGELKLPGYSGYLHPAGEGYMLGIGVGGTEDGLDGSAKISLFDVSDPENMVETDSILLADTWIETDHKAFVTRGENGYIVSCWQWIASAEEDNFIALYFTAENGRLTEVSRAQIGRHMNRCRVLYIGDVLYVYAMGTDFNEETDQYASFENIISYDLNSGVQISVLPLDKQG